jgi:hypothetical protein
MLGRIRRASRLRRTRASARRSLHGIDQTRPPAPPPSLSMLGRWVPSTTLEYKLTAQYHLTPFNQRLQQTPDYMNPLILERALDHFDLD